MSELIQEYETPEEEVKPVREPFVVNNDFKAEWCLDKIRKAKAKQKKQREELQRQMQFYVDQIAKVDSEAEEEIQFFQSMLAPYFVDRMSQGFCRELKSKVAYDLPTGELRLKHVSPTFEYKKEAAKAVEFLKKDENLKQFVRVKEEVNWEQLKKVTTVDGKFVLVKETGEIIPGINVTQNDDVFEVEVK